MNTSYSSITEYPSQLATDEQYRMLATRYHLAAKYSIDKEILEVACGSGIGLSYLSEYARRVLAGDIDDLNIQTARESTLNKTNVHLVKLNAENIPLPDASVDTVILFEAIYYLKDVSSFFREAFRVLRPHGVLIISSVNPTWSGFSPSPCSTNYLTSDDIVKKLTALAFNVNSWCAFKDSPKNAREKLARPIRRIAIVLKLIPKKMANKALLKRIFLGRLSPLPSQLAVDAKDVEPLQAVNAETVQQYKVMYFVAEKITPIESTNELFGQNSE